MVIGPYWPDPAKKIFEFPHRGGHTLPSAKPSVQRLIFLTNHFALPALTIAALYKRRWQVELFFKWIKQNLRIRHFYGTSENAVKTQIWTAVCVYALAAIVKKELALDVALYTFLQILSVHSFEKIPILQAFSHDDPNPAPITLTKQLNLFNT